MTEKQFGALKLTQTSLHFLLIRLTRTEVENVKPCL